MPMLLNALAAMGDQIRARRDGQRKCGETLKE
jgi:hypothetical protein